MKVVQIVVSNTTLILCSIIKWLHGRVNTTVFQIVLAEYFHSYDPKKVVDKEQNNQRRIKSRKQNNKCSKDIPEPLLDFKKSEKP